MAVGPEISVVVPVYNRTEYIAQAVQSILDQRGLASVPEIIVVDDGSEIPVRDVWQPRHDSIQLHRISHRGVSAARNFGLEKSHGSIIAFLDSDDLWAPEKLAVQLRELRNDPQCAMVFTDVAVIDSLGRRIRTSYVRSRRCRRWVPELTTPIKRMKQVLSMVLSTVVIRRVVYESIGGFHPDLSTCEDFDFFLRAAESFCCTYIPQTCVSYRRSNSGIHYDTDKMEQNFRQALGRFEARHTENCSARRIAGKYARRIFYRSIAIPLMRNGEWQGARRCFQSLLTEHPLSLTGMLGFAACSVPWPRHACRDGCSNGFIA